MDNERQFKLRKLLMIDYIIRKSNIGIILLDLITGIFMLYTFYMFVAALILGSLYWWLYFFGLLILSVILFAIDFYLIKKAKQSFITKFGETMLDKYAEHLIVNPNPKSFEEFRKPFNN